MKPNNFIAMVAAVMAVAGCARLETDMVPHSGEYKVYLQGECDTRTSFAPDMGSDKRSMLWKTGDMLGLFVSEDNEPLAGAQNVLARLFDGETDGPGFQKGSFMTELPLVASKTYTLGIYYPYTASAGTASGILHKIPTLQTQSSSLRSDHIGISGCFAYATAAFSTPTDMQYYDSPVMTFTLAYKTSVMHLSLTAASAEMAGWKVKSVTVKTPQGCPIAGDVKYEPSSDQFTLVGNQSESVTLNVSGGAVLSADTPVDLYLIAFPVSLAGKDIELTYTLQAADDSRIAVVTHTKTIQDSSRAFRRSTVHVFDEAIPASDCDGWAYSASDAFDLSANGTSNCYIVSAPGKYSFGATVIGNGQKGVMLPVSTTHFHTDTASIAPTGASLVWQTSPDLITDLSFSDGRVTFTKSSTSPYGNALIAAKDASGNILWSWHIWCTDTGDTQTWVSETGVYEAMDRNLGATYASNSLVTDKALATRTVGMFYQWGRKDPFPGPAELSLGDDYSVPFCTLYDIDGQVCTRPAPVARDQANVAGERKSIEYTVLNPDVFLKGTASTNDWFTTVGTGSGPTQRGYYLWGNPEGYNHASSTKPTPVKTIYDPCPPGYMVPPGDFYTGLVQGASGEYGKLYTTGDTTVMLPFTSCINGYTENGGKWQGSSLAGYYWNSTFAGANVYRTYNFHMGVSTHNTARVLGQVYGFSTRCVQEIN